MIKFNYNNHLIKMNGVNGDHIANAWRYGIFYENKLLEKIKSMNVGGTYIDIGAHHGNHSVFFDKFCKSTRVISIEGNPFNFRYLCSNIKNNSCNNILYNKIISDKGGERLTMQYNMKNTGMSTVVDNHVNGDNTIVNFTDTIDNILKDESEISLIKIDVENYEYNVLVGSERIIEKHHPIIVIELHTTNPHYNKIKKLLSKHNYVSDNVNYAASPTYIYTHVKR